MPCIEHDWQQLLQEPLSVSEIVWPNKQVFTQSFMVHLENRDDFINGNKGFKTLPNLMAAKARGLTQIISFGGRHSNHLYALAVACKRYDLQLVAVVRGYPEQALTPTIEALIASGAIVHFVGFSDYKKRRETDFIESLLQRFGQSWVIPEGGDNRFGQQGVQALARQLAAVVSAGDYLALAVGSGNTLAGLLAEPALANVNIIAVQVLHNQKELHERFGSIENCHLITGFEGAGFAKISPELALFIRQFEALQATRLDPVYTCKLLQAVQQLQQQSYFSAEQRVFCLHTGGLQGRQAMQATIEKHTVKGAVA